ncbi:MAG TPA: hypothetical protein EYN26_02180 [Chromatiales bacterium]|jgi:hypothetical protein|nr:hypothetical protein [Chromatiaceae bacterium]HIO13920.1 hypothetical protein [Chromatiales bacterium]HIO53937.1 hypothetical protein [Chromatiales bacterium]
MDLVGEPQLSPAEPLWKRVPTRDDEGRPVSDFMMLIPKFRSWPQERAERAVLEIQTVFEQFSQVVVFADLNLKLNLLWVSVKSIPGIQLQVVHAVRQRVPEAVLIGNQAELILGERFRRRWW